MLRQLQSPDCDHSRRNDAVKNTVNRFILGLPDDEQTTETWHLVELHCGTKKGPFLK